MRSSTLKTKTPTSYSSLSISYQLFKTTNATCSRSKIVCLSGLETCPGHKDTIVEVYAKKTRTIPREEESKH